MDKNGVIRRYTTEPMWDHAKQQWTVIQLREDKTFPGRRSNQPIKIVAIDKNLLNEVRNIVVRSESPLLHRRQMPRLVRRAENNHAEENYWPNCYNCFQHRCHLQRIIQQEQCNHMVRKGYCNCAY